MGLDGADKRSLCRRNRLPTAPNSSGVIKVVTKAANPQRRCPAPVFPAAGGLSESKNLLLLSDAGQREPPRAPPQHPRPGGIHLLAPYLPAAPRPAPLSVGRLLAALVPGRLLRKDGLLFFKPLANYSAKFLFFFFFACPGVLLHLPCQSRCSLPFPLLRHGSSTL